MHFLIHFRNFRQLYWHLYTHLSYVCFIYDKCRISVKLVVRVFFFWYFFIITIKLNTYLRSITFGTSINIHLEINVDFYIPIVNFHKNENVTLTHTSLRYSRQTTWMKFHRVRTQQTQNKTKSFDHLILIILFLYDQV